MATQSRKLCLQLLLTEGFVLFALYSSLESFLELNSHAIQNGSDHERYRAVADAMGFVGG